MLTRDLLTYTASRGRVQPRFLDLGDDVWLAFAAQLWTIAHDGVGETRANLTSAMQACIDTAPQALIAKGLAKLVTDRLDFAEASDDATALRLDVFARAASVLRGLPQEASSRATYEQALVHAGIGSPRDEAFTASLYADLPDARPLLALRAWTPDVTLQRYNLAQVQGLLLHSHGLTLRTATRDVLRIRRVLRWLKFCRLVADVQHADGAWTLQLSGPAAMFSQQKKYGMQLATFLPAAPLLDDFVLEADIEMRRGTTWRLRLDASAPLVSPYNRALGHIPEEITALQSAFADGAWTILTEPLPRHVGARDMCVPDFSFQHINGDAVHVELFHRWHHHALLRRLEGLRDKPDADLWLGVDRALIREAHVEEAVNTLSNVFLFSGMPTQRRLKERLDQRAAACGAQL